MACHTLNRGTFRIAASSSLALCVIGMGAAASTAATLPQPVPSIVGQVAGAVTSLTPAAKPPLKASAALVPVTSRLSAPAAAPKSAASGTAGSSAAVEAPALTPAAPRASVAAATPVATVCLIPTLSSSPSAQVDLTAAGIDLSSPMIKQFPQALSPCPNGTVPATGSGASDPVAASDASVQGLVGACVRITRQGTPAQTTIVVLDQNLVQRLTAAGVPLSQLLVPCPAAGAGTGGTGGATGGGAGGSGGADRAGATSGAAGGQASSALPDRLAFTGSELLPMLLTAVALLGLGAILVRRARLLARRF